LLEDTVNRFQEKRCTVEGPNDDRELRYLRHLR
jgi:hypothetical protein